MIETLRTLLIQLFLYICIISDCVHTHYDE